MTASITTTTEPAATDAIAALQAAVPHIAAWLQYRAWYTRVPGVQYAIWFDGAVQASGAFGFADLAGGRRMTDRHLFRVASHSKTFTATAVLQLAERGKLRLDDRVAEHLPELAGTPAGAVTVRELLEHGGGILRDGVDSDHWQHARPFPDEARLIEIARLDGIKAQPNERFGYSNIGYSLLGLIVARASGIPFREYLAANIAEPLGLRDTTADLVAERGADYATGYSGLHTARERMPIPHVDTGAMSAATGVTSTARDLVRYLAAHRIGSGELLSDESKRLQQRGLWRSGDDADQEYGLGFVIERIAGRRVIGHSGGYPGHITKSLIDPEDGIAVSVLTNAVDGPASELAAGVFTMLDAALQRTARLSFTAVADPVDATRFEGRFANLWGVLDVFRLGERLLAHSPTAPAPLTRPIELTVEDDTTLRVTAGDGYGAVGETLRYEFDANGTAVSLRGAGGMSWWPFDVDADGFRVPWVQRGE
jgi:CubicO group peptidase (beta-lactamase class C family)